MKKYLLNYFVFLCLIANGQKKDYISISYFSALPVGDFAKSETNYVSNSLGYSKNGFGLDLSYVSKSGNSNFGYSATFRIRQNKIDTSSFFSKKPVVNPFLPPPVFFVWNKKEVSWSLISLMIGGYYSKSLSNKIALNGKVLTGISNAVLPEINWTAKAQSPNVGTAEFKRNRASKMCLSSLVAIGMEFKINKKLCFLTTGEYMYAKPTFKNVTYNYSEIFVGNSIGEYGNINYNIDMSTINLNFGFAFYL